jgi:hypothetical protein
VSLIHSKMEAAGDRVTEKVQSLSDLELAVLICLVAEQHCIIESEAESTRDVQEELKLASWNHMMRGLIVTINLTVDRLRQTCSGLLRQSWSVMSILRWMTLEMGSWFSKRESISIEARPKENGER